MRSMRSPMIAMSRAAISSIRSTAAASQVGLSHSTQSRRPCNIASESKGRLAGFIAGSLDLQTNDVVSRRPYERDRRGDCKVKDLRETCMGQIGQIAIDAQGAWCKSQIIRVYSVLVRPNNELHA